MPRGFCDSSLWFGARKTKESTQIAAQVPPNKKKKSVKQSSVSLDIPDPAMTSLWFLMWPKQCTTSLAIEVWHQVIKEVLKTHDLLFLGEPTLRYPYYKFIFLLLIKTYNFKFWCNIELISSKTGWTFLYPAPHCISTPESLDSERVCVRVAFSSTEIGSNLPVQNRGHHRSNINCNKKTYQHQAQNHRTLSAASDDSSSQAGKKYQNNRSDTLSHTVFREEKP